ncbi:MAG TPA: epoxide hydrolase [Planctomycetota bacterium]|nr:epoxide hydrolase [Planctomycetota bacterium]
MQPDPGLTRRRFCEVAAAAPLGLAASVAAAQQEGDETAVRPFRVSFPEADLAELRRRINATRWPEREPVPDASQGVQLATIQKVARYWGTDYDWSACEKRLNALPNFMTTIDGLDIHFIHVRSKHENALPLLITHGWPGSVVEQLKLVDPLSNPTAHGADASDAFHLVIPSIPGYGFSGRPSATGWDPAHIGRAWVQLMRRLGYTRFAASGGDWGALLGEVMAASAPPELLGIHTNLPFTLPAEMAKAAQAGAPAPAGLSPDERRAYDQAAYFLTRGLGYAIEMANRPQTLYGIADSPVGLAAWFLDHDIRSYELIARVFDGRSEGITREDVLDNLTLTWLTNTGVSGGRIYWENKVPFLVPLNVTIPVAVSAFPDELYQAPRSWAERAYPKLVYYKKHDKGGHFAAWEQPQLLTEDIRAGFRSLREQKPKKAGVK